MNTYETESTLGTRTIRARTLHDAAYALWEMLGFAADEKYAVRLKREEDEAKRRERHERELIEDGHIPANRRYDFAFVERVKKHAERK